MHPFRILLGISVSVLLASAAPPNRIPPRWWETGAGIIRVSFREADRRIDLRPEKLAPELDRLKQLGFTAIEVFAPYDGGESFGGLDAVDRYKLEPSAGTMADWRRFVRMAHDRGLAVIAFDNLGYSSIDAPEFVKACADPNSKEANWYLWAKDESAPPPPGNSYFAIPGQAGHWAKCPGSGRLYWSKWSGPDKNKQRVPLPQYNWGTKEWQAEVARVIRFWMQTGIDGMVIDAVNWYLNYGWDTGHEHILKHVAAFGDKFTQPEGAGGFKEDPVAWVSEGGWKCVQNYGMGVWWERWDHIRKAIETGDPRPIEMALRNYHDRVVAAGGVLYHVPPAFEDRDQEHLAVATVAAVGNLVSYHDNPRHRKLTIDDETGWILRTKAAYPAMGQLSLRRKLPTAADDKHYAFLRTARDGRSRILAVLNYQSDQQMVDVDLSGVRATTLRDVRSGEKMPVASRLRIPVPRYGYRFFAVE